MPSNEYYKWLIEIIPFVLNLSLLFVVPFVWKIAIAVRDNSRICGENIKHLSDLEQQIRFVSTRVGVHDRLSSDIYGTHIDSKAIARTGNYPKKASVYSVHKEPGKEQ